MPDPIFDPPEARSLLERIQPELDAVDVRGPLAYSVLTARSRHAGSRTPTRRTPRRTAQRVGELADGDRRPPGARPRGRVSRDNSPAPTRSLRPQRIPTGGRSVARRRSPPGRRDRSLIIQTLRSIHPATVRLATGAQHPTLDRRTPFVKTHSVNRLMIDHRTGTSRA